MDGRKGPAWATRANATTLVATKEQPIKRIDFTTRTPLARDLGNWPASNKSKRRQIQASNAEWQTADRSAARSVFISSLGLDSAGEAQTFSGRSSPRRALTHGTLARPA